MSRVRCLAARRYPSVDIHVTVGDSQVDWSYLLRFKQDNQRTPLVEEEKVWRGGKLIVDRPDSDDDQDRARLTQTHLEQVTANVEFRDLAEFFSSVSYLHVVPQLIRDADASPAHAQDPYGAGLIERIASVNRRTQRAWLGRIRDALQLAVPQLSELEIELQTIAVCHISVATTTIGVLRVLGRTNATSRMGPCALLACFGHFLNRADRCSLRSPNNPFIPESSSTCRRCWRACNCGGDGKRSSALTPRTSCVTAVLGLMRCWFWSPARKGRGSAERSTFPTCGCL